MQKSIQKASISGAISAILLLSIYFIIVTIVSNWGFTVDQFNKYWPFLITLAIGFGVQVALYVYLKAELKNYHNSRMLAISGTTSTATMISCCTHYLVNFLPILGVTGVVTFVAQYQTQLFWFGIFLNIIGILYMLKKVREVRKFI